MRRFPARGGLLTVPVVVAALFWVLRVYSQGQLLVGYATVEADENSTLPVASALFAFHNSDGILVAEAGVGAVEPIRRGRIFVDAAVPTGLALANPSPQGVTANLSLRDASGAEVASAELVVPAFEHRARFVSEAELFGDLPPGFIGSLSFETVSPGLAAVTIRQSSNAHGEPLFATLPVADLDRTGQPPASASAKAYSPHGAEASLIFPHIGAGGILSTQIILINPTGQAISGEIRLTGSDALPLILELDEVEGSAFAYQLEPHGVYKGELTSTSGVFSGYAVVTAEGDGARPAGTAIFQFRDARGILVSEAGVGAVLPTTRARIFVDTVETRTGVAIALPGGQSTEVDFRLLDRNGLDFSETVRDLPAGGHLSIFADELFQDLPPGFTGVLEIEAGVAVVPITLKLTINRRGDLILTTLPVADLTRPSEAVSLVLPQVGFGLGFSTRIILISVETNDAGPGTSTGRLRLTQSDGSALVISLLREAGSDFGFRVNTSGASQLRPGDTASLSQLLVDPSGLFSSEIVVNRGNQLPLRPVAVDSEGRLRDDFPIQYQSIDPGVATVDELGRITGNQAGFSTLTVSSGAVVVTRTVTVVEVNASVTGLEVRGIARDLAQRFYLSNTSDHTVLRSSGPELAPELYSGTEQSAGFRNSTRLASLFNQPTFLAFNQSDGALYVADSANHRIRRILPGTLDRVETFAGNGQAGSSDGPALESAFNRPQGIALDNRGNLWIADSHNHTIRKMDLITGELQTIAGLAGVAGRLDGFGEEARLNRPLGIAVEAEPLAQRLDRELRQLPPPPVQIVVADFGNRLIRRVREDGLVETIAGTDSRTQSPAGPLGPGLFQPVAVGVDANGNIFFSEGDEVLTILPDRTIVRAAEAGSFDRPGGVSISRAGEVAVADMTGVSELRFGRPEISELQPDQISNQGAEIVTVRGRNFSSDSVAVIGRDILDVEVLDTQTLRFTTPALPSGVTTLTVQNRGGVAQRRFVIDPKPIDELELGHITTVAGGSTFVGDGERATEIGLSSPRGLAVDPAGNLYIADVENNRVRRVDAITGVITTVAGTGEDFAEGPPQRPDGILATMASIQPEQLTADGAGNLFVKTAFDVLRVDSASNIINEYFDGFGFIEIAADSAGNLFLVRRFDHDVIRVDAQTREVTTVAGTGEAGFSGDGGPAAEAQLDFPEGIAVDAGNNLFLIDNGRVRRIDADSGVISTVAGGGGPLDPPGDGGPAVGARLDRPELVAVDGAGNLYIKQATFQDPSIRRVDVETGVISTLITREVIGDVIADASGNVYFSDSVSHQAFRVDGPGGEPILLAGNGMRTPIGDEEAAVAATFDRPDDLAFDREGSLFVADSFAERIRRIDAQTGIISTVAGNGSTGSIRPPEGTPAVEASLFSPESPAVDFEGNLYFTDLNDFWRVDAQTGLLSAVQVPQTRVHSPVIDPAGHLVFVSQDQVLRLDLGDQSVTAIAGTGERGYSGDGGPATEAMISTGRITFDSAGNLFLAEREPDVVRRIDSSTGIIETVAGGGDCFGFCDGRPATEVDLFLILDIALDVDANLFILDAVREVYRVDPETGILTTVASFFPFASSLDNTPATAAIFDGEAIDIDADGNLFIADPEQRRVRAVRLR